MSLLRAVPRIEFNDNARLRTSGISAAEEACGRVNKCTMVWRASERRLRIGRAIQWRQMYGIILSMYLHRQSERVDLVHGLTLKAVDEATELRPHSRTIDG